MQMPRFIPRVKDSVRKATERIAIAKLRKEIARDIREADDYAGTEWTRLRKHKEVLEHLRSDAGARFYSDIRALVARRAEAEDFHKRLNEFCKEKGITYERLADSMPPLLGTLMLNSIAKSHEERGDELAKADAENALVNYARARVHHEINDLLYSEANAARRMERIDRKIDRLTAKHSGLNNAAITERISQAVREIGEKWRVLEEDEK